MSELPFTGLPYTSLQNRRTPRSVYHIDAAGLKSNFEKLASGEAMDDESIGTRHITPELALLLSVGITGSVDTYDLLPSPSEIASGRCYLVKTDIENYPGGVYQSDGVETWTFLYDWINKFSELVDGPGTLLGNELKSIRVNAAGDALEFYTPEPGGGAKPDFVAMWMSGSANYPNTNPSESTQLIGANSNSVGWLFDATTEEFIVMEPAIEIPSDIDPAGTVTFVAWAKPVTPAASI